MEKDLSFLEKERIEEPNKLIIRLLLLSISMLILGFGAGGVLITTFTLMIIAIGIPEFTPFSLMFSALLALIGIIGYTDILSRKESWILKRVLATGKWSDSPKTSS